MLARFAKATHTPLPLLTGAPPTQAEWTAMAETAGEWSFADGLLVAVAERVDALRYMVQKALSEKHANVAEPLRVPRPGETPESAAGPVVMRASEFAKLLATGGRA